MRLREYVVTIDNKVTSRVYAKDRKDAIAFVKRNNQARIHRGEYKKSTGCKLVVAPDWLEKTTSW